MRHFSSAAFLIVVALLLPSRATADSSVATQTNFGPGIFNPMVIQPFDPALGTLNSVNVTLDGQVTASATAFICGLQGSDGCPFTLTLDQNFFGISPAFFSFGTDAQFVFDGIGIDASFIQSYSYTFTFDAFTDNILNGFTLPNFSPLGVGNAAQIIPPVDINGTRASFLPTLVGLNEIDDLLIATPSAATVLNYNDAGTLVVEYNYTPAPVPEPGSLLLIITGIGSLITRKLFSAN